MRITQSMLSNNMLNNLMKSQTKMDKYMEQLYTGKKISRPSDDPVIAMKGINYRSQVQEVEQYQRNTSEVHNWMDNTDSALDQATNALQRMSELTVQASNGTQTPADLETIQKEVIQLRDHLIEIANTEVNGNYIFNGTNTDTPPIKFDEDGEIDFKNISEENQPFIVEVASGSTIQANIDTSDVFSKETFKHIQGLLDKLEGKDIGENMDKSLEHLNVITNKVIDSRSTLGARMNRLELVENRLEDQKINATKTMSDNEDIHFEEAITNLITQETLHRAALSAGSRIIQPTLLDFLR